MRADTHRRLLSALLVYVSEREQRLVKYTHIVNATGVGVAHRLLKGYIKLVRTTWGQPPLLSALVVVGVGTIARGHVSRARPLRASAPRST